MFSILQDALKKYYFQGRGMSQRVTHGESANTSDTGLWISLRVLPYLGELRDA